MATASDEERLREELKTALWRPLPRLFEDGLRGDSTTFPVLAGIISKLRDGWRLNDALRDVIQLAVELLPDNEFPASKDGKLWRSKLSWREVGQLLTGFAADLEGPEGGGRHSYKGLCAILRQKAKLPIPSVSESSFNRHVTGALKNRLTSILVNRQAELHVLVALPQSPQVISSSGYIRREGLEAEFQSALDQGIKVVVLVGQTGMGKTWLARNLAFLSDGSRAPRVRFRAGIPDTFDVQRAMSECGMEGIIKQDEQAVYHLLSLCSGPLAPSMLVLDNLDSANEIHALFPDGTKSTIVATCRVKGRVRAPGYRFIRVGHMEESEATKLIYSHLTWTREADVARLAKLLHGFPLAISHACTLVGRSGWSLDEFEREFIRSRAAIVGKLTTEDQAALVVILRRMLTLLESSSPLAHSVLCHIVNTLMHGAIASKGTVWQLTQMWAEGISSVTSEEIASISKYEFEEAVLTLVDYAFIDVHSGVDIYNLPLVEFTIHPLVLDLLSPEVCINQSLHILHVRSSVANMLIKAGCRIGGNFVMVRLEAEDLTTFFVFVRNYGYIVDEMRPLDSLVIESEPHSLASKPPPYRVIAARFLIGIAEPDKSLFATLFQIMADTSEPCTVDFPRERFPVGFSVKATCEIEPVKRTADETETLVRALASAVFLP